MENNIETWENVALFHYYTIQMIRMLSVIVYIRSPVLTCKVKHRDALLVHKCDNIRANKYVTY